MPSIKLTDAIRYKLKRELLWHAFHEELTEMQQRRAALAVELYCEAFSQEMREQMAALPEGWLPTTTTVRVSLAGVVDHVPLNGSNPPQFRLAQFKGNDGSAPLEFRIPSCKNHTVVLALQHPHPLVQCWERLGQDWAELAARITRAENLTWAALKAMTTINRAREQWPELDPFLKTIEAAQAQPAPLLPAPRIKELNELLGLPGQEAA